MYIVADEAGDFAFERGEGKSLFFILCTVRMRSCEVGAALLDLRRSMRLRDIGVGNQFHATSDPWPVRREVFEEIAKFDFDIDATILRKPRAQPRARTTEAVFFKYAWFYHAKFLFKKLRPEDGRVLISASALETKRGKAAFRSAFNDAVQQTAVHLEYAIDFPPSISDPCLQLADYCAWALQRKWEKDDCAMHEKIAPRIKSEFDLWRFGTAEYY